MSIEELDGKEELNLLPHPKQLSEAEEAKQIDDARRYREWREEQ